MPYQQAISHSGIHPNTPGEAAEVQPRPLNESLNRGPSCCLTCAKRDVDCIKQCKRKRREPMCDSCDDTCLDYVKMESG